MQKNPDILRFLLTFHILLPPKKCLYETLVFYIIKIFSIENWDILKYGWGGVGIENSDVLGYQGGGGQKSAKKFGYPKWTAPNLEQIQTEEIHKHVESSVNKCYSFFNLKIYWTK